MSFHFSHPEFLIGLAILPLVVWGYFRSLTDLPRRQRIGSLFLRLGMITLLVLSLADPGYQTDSRQKAVLLLVDESQDVTGEEKAESDILHQCQEIAKGKEIPLTILPFNRPRSYPVTPEQVGIDFPTALKIGVSLLPTDRVPSILLLSDGSRIDEGEIGSISKLGIPLSVIPLPTSSSPEVQMAEIHVPSVLREGEPFNAELIVRSRGESEGVLSLWRGNLKVAEEKKNLHPGENRFLFPQTAEGKGTILFSARIDSPNDSIVENNLRTTLVEVIGRPRVLLITENPAETRPFSDALREQGIDPVTRPPEGIPTRPTDLDPFDALILSNIPADAISPGRMETIRHYLSDSGGGLLTLGGDQAFGPGGYYKSPLDDLLPVDSRQSWGREKPSLALGLVIDRSGSMAGEKIAMAKEAAKETADFLTDRDFLTIVTFDREATVPLPIRPRGDPVREPVNALLTDVGTGGGTNLYPALTEAIRQLTTVKAKIKHLILLTDGHSEPGDFDEILREMTDHGITLSTIGIGDAETDLLEEMARRGNGRFYACADPASIPRIFTRETSLASRSAIEETPFFPQIPRPDETLSGIDFRDVPPLLGHVIVGPKSASSILLTTESDDPLLAWWRYGLGISAAFTSDVTGRWGAEWLSWSEFPLFWGRIVRHVMRKVENSDQALEVLREGDRVRIRLNAVDATDRFVNRESGELMILNPDGAERQFPLPPIAPGLYETTLPLSDPGTYSFRATLTADHHPLLTATGRLSIDYPDSLRLEEPDFDLLQRIAGTSGGLFEPSPSDFFREETDRTVKTTHSFRSGFLAVALLLYLPDILLRRVVFRRRSHRRKGGER